MARGTGCGKDGQARPRSGDVDEQLLRDVHTGLTIRFGTDAPYRIGKIGFEKVGYAQTPMLVVPVDVPANAIDALVPIARQAAFAYLAERGVPDSALQFACSVRMGRKRRFADDNESSPSHGANKMGLACAFHFECTPMLTAAVQWGANGTSSYGQLKAAWEIAAAE